MIHQDNTGKIFWISLVVSLLVSSIVSLVMIIFVAPQLEGVLGTETKKSATVEVPSLVNMSVDQARVIAQNKGLNIIIESTRESETMPENYVLNQDPLPGVPAVKGSVIKVVLSSGMPKEEVEEPKEEEPQEVIIPYMRGLTLKEAEDKIVSLGFVIGDISYRVSSTISPGRVIQTDPPAGSRLVKGSAINLTVAKQEVKVTVPKLYGKKLAYARKVLASRGLKLGSIHKTTDVEKPFDIIISQSPVAGSKVKKGTSVSVTINVESY